VWGLSENMDEVFDILKEYSKHIETVYKMDTYHGDSVIENLLKHSQAVGKTLEAYIEAREIVQPPLEQEIDDTE
jgi:predicted metal-binding protein